MFKSLILGVLLIVHLIKGQVINTNEHHIPDNLKYDGVTTPKPIELGFVPLSPVRTKRENDEDIDPATATFPSNVVVENDSYENRYYTLDVFQDDEKMLKRHWVEIDNLLDKPGVVGNRSHPLLSKSYRRAVGTKISFKFPFYGNKMKNLTIATGGFIYIGDETHNWLAATQYIAPLMANFHTLMNTSNIIYADDGEIFVVEWRNVQLREDPKKFTFQAILHKNGDIVFAYKNIPINVTDISETYHPVKLGISDAYLLKHNIEIPGAGSQPKRVIYEYHRIEVSPAKIQSNTVVILKAMPTCLHYETCESCSNATLKHFNCHWCHSSKKNGGSFCTDDEGVHRRRQHWAESNCNIEASKKQTCDKFALKEFVDYYGDDNEAQSTKPVKIDRIETKKISREDVKRGTFGSISFLLGCILIFFIWLVYAYYNPHTRSGQLLIKYRPSRWHVPNSHVRYSASVHM